ncbi:hypothetical protein ONE63_006410 [Megalurothrips usitatus]|uniref:Yemanuclein n=1 Tax=Megalurothrips usitatus TaxID=439358 RepID=A0AAV7XVV1_9NEOP|nr:hypothetical protein ONE63_006410 [Megalurothrips usitatus]
MSEGKRVSLQSIGPAKKEKKCKPTSTTIRLTLTLPACNSDSFADFNYNSLILNEKRKREKNKDKEEKVNGVSGLDPYASDDEEGLRQIARSFESKYGTPKKKCRRLEDYTELGTGYDDNDSFIDNTDAYDEVVPEDQTPELDGFYINKGQLVLKHVHGRSSSDHSDSDDSDGPQNSRSQKRALSSESESSGSGSSSDGSDDSDDSEDSEEEDEGGNDESEGETEESPRESLKNSPKDLKEEKSNGHAVSPVAKKSKLSDVPSKKAKNKAITGLFIKKAVSEKEHNDKRQKIDSSEKEPSEKRQKMENSEKDPVERVQQPQKFDSDGVRRLSNVDAAIEAVARGEDSKESGIAESKSRSGSSDESDAEESMASIAPPLPEGLPENIWNVISLLKEVAVKNSNLGKQQFFTPEVNALLLRFEKQMRFVPRDKKGGVYDHLECFVPCRKETFMKRGKALLMESVEAAVKEPLTKLKAGVNAIMPSAVEKYLTMCKKCVSNREAPADQSDSLKPSEKMKAPRKRFPWTEELKNQLCLAVKKRRVYYGTVKQKGETWEEHLRAFLKNDVTSMWPDGWIKIANLLEIISKMAPDLLQFKPVNPGNKLKKSIPCPPPAKKMAPKATAVADDMLRSDLPSKKPNVLPGGLTVTPKPLQIMNHQNQNNSVLKPSSESCAKSAPSLSNGAQTITSTSSVQPSNLPPVSQTSSFDLLGSEIVQCIRTSLANSLVSVTPVQSSFMAASSQGSSVNVDSGSKVRSALTSSAPIKKALNSSVDIINLKTNGMDSSVEIVPKKRSPSVNSSLQSGHPSISSSQTPSTDLQDLSKPQLSSSLASVPSSLSSQITSSHQSTSSPSSIKVASVSAINLKLGGPQSQPTSSKSALSQPLKVHSQPSMPASSNLVHQPASSYSSPSVISHGLETGNLGVSSSLTITPVKPSTTSNTYYQQTKATGHLNIQSGISSVVSQINSNTRSEVIVTPSSNSSMPHIKSTNVNFSASSTNSVSSSNNYTSSHSSGNNFSTSLSGSSNTYTNSRGVSSNSYQSSLGIGGSGYPNVLSSSDISVRTHRPQAHTSSQVSKAHGSEKNSFAQPSRSHVSEKASYLSSNMWPPAVSVDIPRSSSSSPSSVKSVTPSPEKALVSRKDRILQDSRERASNDPAMPTLSGPYRSTITASDPTNVGRNQSQAKTPQSLNWDDELVIIEDFLKMSSPSSSMPQNTHKVSTASLDSYKHTLPILEPQRCDNVSSKSSHLDPPRARNLSVSSSEPHRVNVVMPTPQMRTSPGYTQHTRDQPRANAIISNHTIREIQRPSSAKSSSSNSDSQRENVVMPTPHFQEALRDEMSDILAGIPTQMISRTDHYTITNSMPSHNSKRKSILEMSDIDMDMAIGAGVPPGHSTSNRSDPKGKQEESLQKAQERAMQGILMSRTNCDGNYVEEPWGGPMKKTVSNKSSNDISDQRLSGMGALSSSLSMTGLDGMGLGLPSHLVGFQNDYQRHLYGSSSKTTGNCLLVQCLS